MKNNLLRALVVLFTLSITLSNSRIAFSRPSTLLRTPSVQHIYAETNPYLFTAGFSTETINFDLPSQGISLYLQTHTNSGLNLGLSYSLIADPRSKEQIDTTTTAFEAPTELGLHAQKTIYSANNIKIDMGISDVIARDWNGNSSFLDPSLYAIFSSYKEFDKFSITYNFGFGSGLVALDEHVQELDFLKSPNSSIGYFLGFNLLTPEIPRLKNRLNLLFELDGTNINIGAKLPITDEYLISMGVTNFSGMGDFGNRSKIGQEDQTVLSNASTLCFGFEMNVPKMKKNQYNNPYGDPNQTYYTEEAVMALKDSLNQIINLSEQNYSAIADSIKFLKFSLENNSIENISLSQKIASLEDSLYQRKNQKVVDIANYNKASRHISRALRYYYEQEYNQALIEIDSAIELNPNLAIAYARKGTIYYSMGQIQSASINWNIALKLDPEYDEVRDILEALKSNKLKSADLQE